MALEDSPIVDKSAERSEESILKTQLAFSRKNGFISHKIDGSDDYGVDINCQMIQDGKALPFQFPIQVKSKIAYENQVIDGESYKKCVFVNSRLGYLMKHQPTTGLIVIYDDSTSELFFEFGYVIYNRIRESHKDDSWKQQDKITIHIPTKNILNTDTICKLHSTLSNIFTASQQLIFDYGISYDIPASIGYEGTNSPKSFLLKFGETLLGACKYNEIVHNLNKLSREAYTEGVIMYLGAVAYTEFGDIINADYFFSLCKKYSSKLSEKVTTQLVNW